MTTCVGAELQNAQDLGCISAFTKGGGGGSKEERGGFPFCGGFPVTMNKDGYPLPRFD